MDNLSISLNGLSMITPSKTEPIMLEILGLRTQFGQAAGNPGTWPAFPADFRLSAIFPAPPGYAATDFQMLDSDTYTTFRQIEDRLEEIAKLVGQLINGSFTAGDFEFRDVLAFPAPYSRHLQFVLHNSGRLGIYGSRTFWSYFCIHIPNGHYRSIFYGSSFVAGDARQRPSA